MRAIIKELEESAKRIAIRFEEPAIQHIAINFAAQIECKSR